MAEPFMWIPRTDKILRRIREEEDKLKNLTPPPEPPPEEPIETEVGSESLWGSTTLAGAGNESLWGQVTQDTGYGSEALWGQAGVSTAKKPWYEKPMEYYSRPAAANIMLPIWAQMHPEDPGSQLYQEFLSEVENPLQYFQGFLPEGKARQAYNIAQMPRGSRSAVEMATELPIWMAIPGATGLRAGKLAQMAAGLPKGASAAEIAAGLAKPAIGKGAKVARGARALLKPVEFMEKAPIKLLQKLTKRQPITSLKVLGRIWDKSPAEDREALAKLAGLDVLPETKIPKVGKIIPKKVTPITPEVTEPWQMTREKYFRQIVEKEEPTLTSKWEQATYGEHQQAVSKALSEGKPVPTEVLKDYPDLVKQYGIAIPKAPGITVGIGSRAWNTLGRENQKVIASVFKQPLELVALSADDPTIQPLIRKMIKFADEMQVARTKTDILTTVEKGTRVINAEKAMNKVLKAGGTADEAMQAFKGKLKTPYPFEKFMAPENIPTPVEIDKLKRLAIQLAPDRFDKLNATEALTELFDATITRPMQPHKLETLRRIFGDDFVNAIRPLSRLRKGWNRFMEIANLPRAFLASGDVSATFRQNLFELLAHPQQFPKMFGRQARAMISEEAMIKADAEFWAREGMTECDAIIKKAGIRGGLREYMSALPGTPGATMYQKAEPFMSHWSNNIPGVKHSGRGFITATNDVFSYGVSDYWKLCKSIASTTDIMEYVKMAGNSIGRGSLGSLKFASPILNATLFAPRYTMSLFRLPTFLFSPSPLVRKEAMKRMVRFLIFGLNTLRVLQMSGAKVEFDSLSSDFGKIRLGKTRIDYWRGYSQLTRFMTQLITARRKSTTGKMYETTRKEVIERFFQSKFSPGMGLLYDLLVGKTYMGEEIEMDTEKLKRQAFVRWAPLTIQDFVDALEEEGLMGAIGAGTASALGLGVQTYKTLGKYEPGGFGETGFGGTGFGKTGFK